MRILKYQIIWLLILGCAISSAQSGDGLYKRISKNAPENDSIIANDTGRYVLLFNRNICKGFEIKNSFIGKQGKAQKTATIALQSVPKPEFLQVHGNISYDFFYRSRIDTPLNINDFQQHTERVYLNILVKEKYPLKVSFAARQSNSPFFRNFLDANFQFDPSTFRRTLKEDLVKKITLKLLQSPEMDSLESKLRQNIKKYASLRPGLESSSTLQKIIEEREREYYKLNSRKGYVKPPGFSLEDFNSGRTNRNLAGLDRINADRLKYKFSSPGLYEGIKIRKYDTAQGIITAQYNKRKNEADSLYAQIHFLEKQRDSLKNILSAKILNKKKEIYEANNEKELLKIAAREGVQPNSSTKFEKNLLALKEFSVGRSMLNYTELTARNISITGVNIAYNPSYYIAVAAGKTDYRFHDFLNRKASLGNQYLVLGRLGVGDIEKKALILTAFKGRKDQSSFALPDSITSNINIIGYSLEGILNPNRYTALSAEFAKSTKPITGSLYVNKDINSLWQYTDKTNMGINVKAQTSFPLTDTKISGFFRKTGENFQSFSLFGYNTDQTAWQSRIDQSFLKRKMSITAMLRRNDFTNPFTEKTYKTSTTFQTFILNTHFPKYPTLSLGYYPGTQLYVIDKDRISENAYYILNGSLLYYYHSGKAGMNTSLVYNRYFNKATDSGFVLNKGINYYASQTVFLKKLQLQGGYAYTRQTELQYYTIESSMDFEIAKLLKTGAGIKYNKIHEGEVYYGESVRVILDFKRLGGMQFQYEKSYLPTLDQTLYAIETGRVSWYKYF